MVRKVFTSALQGWPGEDGVPEESINETGTEKRKRLKRTTEQNVCPQASMTGPS